MIALFLALQAAPLPDIELRATIEARSVRIEKRGDAKLKITASPDAGSFVKVEAPRANGAQTLRNVRIHVDAEARLGDINSAPATETAPPR